VNQKSSIEAWWKTKGRYEHGEKDRKGQSWAERIPAGERREGSPKKGEEHSINGQNHLTKNRSEKFIRVQSSASQRKGEPNAWARVIKMRGEGEQIAWENSKAKKNKSVS